MDQDDTQDSEARNAIPDSQRRNYDVVMKPIGTVSSYDDVITSLVIFDNWDMTIFDTTKLSPWVYKLVLNFMDEIGGSLYATWLHKITGTMPHGPWIWLDAFGIVFKSFGRFTQTLSISV